MRFATLGLISLTISALGSTARAGASDGATPTPTTDAAARPDTPDLATDKVEWGFDVRLRQVFLPSSIIGLFVERAAGGASNTGYGFDLVRRHGTLELQLGFEFEHVNVAEGVYINSGDNVANGDTVDFILSPDHAPSNFGWYTVEFTFLNHAPINKYVAIRYGGGAGIGVLSGGVYRYDIACSAGATNSNVTPNCVPSFAPYNGQGTISPDHAGEMEPAKYDLPSVFPVINAIIGVQIKPTSKAVINIEGGIRTLPFFGVSAGYFF